ncbi:hypothetical protein YT1_3158 [Rhodococcus ruber]|nr:hypothetical protein YT1_3158 [Rhodococcus ruber]
MHTVSGYVTGTWPETYPPHAFREPGRNPCDATVIEELTPA